MAKRWRGQLHRRFVLRLPLLLAASTVVSFVAGNLVAGRTMGDDKMLWLAPLAAALMGWLIGWFVERRRDARLLRYRRGVRRIGRGDFAATVSEGGERGWSSLGEEIDQAAANLSQWRADFEERLASREGELVRLRAELVRLNQENVRLQQDSLLHQKSAASLEAFVVAINQLGDPPQVAGQLLTYLDSEVDYSIATVMLVDQETQRLEPVAISNREKGLRLVGKYVKDIQTLQPVGAKSAIGRAMDAGKPLLIADADDDRRGLLSRPGIKSEIAVPLRVQDNVIGVVHLESAEADTYSPQNESLLSWLANATATAIGNIRLRVEEAKVRNLREIDKLKSQLISTVSHELRTPLASIKGYSTSLQRPALDDDSRREFLQIIEEEADRLSEMIENLLDLTKIEAGVLRLHRQPVTIERIVRKVLDQVKRHAAHVRFRVRFADSFPLVSVAPHRIEQVIRNLVENALKYAPESSRITVAGDEEDGQVIISVNDEGPGVTAEHRERIFEPFYQIDGGTARRVGGSGLGLAICRGFVAAHGGKIWVESEPGRGSSFRFSLPLSNGADEAAVEAAVFQAAEGG